MPLLFHEEKKRRPFPSPLGRGWPATGVFTSRRGPGEGLLSLPG